MPPKTKQLLKLIADSGFIPDDVLDRVRGRAEQKQASPRSVSRYLVERGHLTQPQADQFLTSAGVSLEASSEKPSSSDRGGALVDELSPLDAGGGARIDDIDSMLNDPSLGGHISSSAKKMSFGKSKWDTKLMLYGGGGLVAMVLLIVLLIFLLTSQSEDTMFRAAEDAYRRADYASAIKLYGEFIEAFPDVDNASTAKVRLGISRMFQVVDSGNYEEALRVTLEVLPQMRTEPQFGIARGDLSVLLPELAEGLVDEANEQQSLALLDMAKEAKALAEDTKHLPDDIRPVTKLQEIQLRISESERLLGRETRLAETIEEINSSIQVGDTATAYQRRKELLAEYPELKTNPQLQESVLAASQRQRDLVTYTATTREAVTTPDQSMLAGDVIPLITTGREATGVDLEFITAFSQGSVFSLDPVSGEVRWRKFVGYDSFPPLELAGAGDVLLYDSAQSELSRVTGRDGELKWRLALDAAPVAEPLVHGAEVFLPLNNRQLLHVDAVSGRQLGFYEFPQQLRTAPAASSDGDFMYLIAEHSNLFILNRRQTVCTMVQYIGHEAGEVRVGPALIGPLMLIVKDSSASASEILGLQVTQDGAAANIIQANVNFSGHVYRQPVIDGLQVVYSTVNGGQYAYNVDPSSGSNSPISEVAKFNGASSDSIVPFVLLRRGELWSARRGLAVYDIQPAAKQIRQRWSRNNSDAYLQPLRLSGSVLFTLRQLRDTPNVRISAVDTKTGDPIWETDLGSPLVGEPWVENGDLLAVNAAGSVFRVPSRNAAQEAGSLPDSSQWVATLNPAAVAPPGTNLDATANIVALDNGRRMIVTPNSRRCLVWDPASSRLSAVELPAGPTCAPVDFQGNLIVPANDGRVYVVDPLTAAHAEGILPFQKTFRPGSPDSAWSGPPETSDNDVLLCDAANVLYRLQVASEPSSHLNALHRLETSIRFGGRFARLNNLAYGLNRDGQLIPISLANDSLALEPPLAVTGGIIWGPKRVGDLAAVVTATGQVAAFHDGGSQAWISPADETSQVADPVGNPLVDPTGFWLADRSGTVFHFDALSGEVDRRVSVGRPIACGPVVWNGMLVVGGVDGSLLMAALSN